MFCKYTNTLKIVSIVDIDTQTVGHTYIRFLIGHQKRGSYFRSREKDWHHAERIFVLPPKKKHNQNKWFTIKLFPFRFFFKENNKCFIFRFLVFTSSSVSLLFSFTSFLFCTLFPVSSYVAYNGNIKYPYTAIPWLFIIYLKIAFNFIKDTFIIISEIKVNYYRLT